MPNYSCSPFETRLEVIGSGGREGRSEGTMLTLPAPEGDVERARFRPCLEEGDEMSLSGGGKEGRKKQHRQLALPFHPFSYHRFRCDKQAREAGVARFCGINDTVLYATDNTICIESAAVFFVYLISPIKPGTVCSNYQAIHKCLPI